MKGVNSTEIRSSQESLRDSERRLTEVKAILLDGEEINWPALIDQKGLPVGEHWFFVGGGYLVSASVFPPPSAPFELEGQAPSPRTFVAIYGPEGTHLRSYSDIPGSGSLDLNLLSNHLKETKLGLRLTQCPSWVNRVNNTPTEIFVDQEIQNVMGVTSTRIRGGLVVHPK